MGIRRTEAAAVRQRLSDAADQLLSHEDLDLSISGRVYLGYLIRKAALTIAAEGKASNSAELDLAEERLRELISAAATGTKANAGAPLQKSS